MSSPRWPFAAGDVLRGERFAKALHLLRDHGYFRFVICIVSPPTRGMLTTYGVFTQSDEASDHLKLCFIAGNH